MPTKLNFNAGAYSRVELPALAFRDCWALLSRMWMKRPKIGFDEAYHFFISARYGLYWVLKSIDLQSKDSVLLPIYHSGSEIRAWLQFTENVRFFDLNQDFSPNLEDIAGKIELGIKAI